ncbi:hypothetical protein [Hirschia litorea]|uniref:Uncharacterized protein n=1 Tax=Hirschia litorea TaxID=1199156 RepID=A0ABW2IJ41_9PROT
MANRISKRLVTFHRPFSLPSLDRTWPAGDYTIETEEEQQDKTSDKAYLHIATIMVVRPAAGLRGTTQFIEIDPTELEAALALDAA